MDPLSPFYFKTVVGMDNRSDELDLNYRKVKLAQNCRFGDEPGSVNKRPPLAYYNSSEISGDGGVLGLYRFYFSGGVKMISVRDDKVYAGDDTTGTFSEIRSLSNSGRRMSFVTYNNLCIGGNGYDNQWCYDGSDDNLTWELGACKAKATTTGGSITKTNLVYTITYDSDAFVPGSVSNTVSSVSAENVTLTNVPLSPSGTGHRKVYRKDSSTSNTFRLVGTITDDATTTFTDSVADVSGEAQLPTVTDEMPKGNIMVIHKERLFIAGDPTEQNRAYYSEPFLPHYIQVNTELSYMDIAKDDGDQIMGLPIHMGTMICIKQNTMRKVYVSASSANVDPATWYADDVFAFSGSPAQWSILQTVYGIIYLGWDQWYIFDGSIPKPFIQEFSVKKILPSLYTSVVSYLNDGIFYASYADADTVASTNNRVVVYHMTVDQYAIDTISASCFTASTGADESGELYIGSSDSGYIYKAEEGDIWYRLSNKTNINAGTLSNVFVGGTENRPTMQIGSAVDPDPIPEGLCIFWDNPLEGPGTGWTEITSYSGRLVKVESTYGTLAGSAHTHSVTGTLLSVNPTSTGVGESGTAGDVGEHTHTFSATTSATDAYPRYFFMKVYSKNSSTVEYTFPIGSYILWDQTDSPDGWLNVTSLVDGHYLRFSDGTGDLLVKEASEHEHSAISGTSSTKSGGSSTTMSTDSTGAIQHPLPGTALDHTHSVTLTLLGKSMDTWELDYVSFNLIKKISEDSPWDGSLKYMYCLFASASAISNGWSDVTDYNGKYLKIASSVTTGSNSNGSHSHIFTETISGNSSIWGGGDDGTAYAAQHTHSLSITVGNTLPDPKSVSVRLVRKLVGTMVPYNDALTSAYTNGTYVSVPIQLSADTFGKMYFNLSLSGSDTFSVFFRTGSTRASVEDGLGVTVDHSNDKFTYASHGYTNGDRVWVSADAYPTGLSGSYLYYVVGVSGNDFQLSLTENGSAEEFSSAGTNVTTLKWDDALTASGSEIEADENIWFSYLIEFTADNTTSTNPTLYSADGFLLKFAYRRSGTIAESSVEFIYMTGMINHDEPMVDKIYKRIATEHVGDSGHLTVSWETENATNEFNIDLASYPKRWQSFFHDTAMGESISITFYKNDLYDLTLKEFKGFYTPQPMLV